MTVSSKSTKAEILSAYEALKAQQEAQYVTLPLVLNTLRRVRDELLALAKDVYLAGAFCRKASQPLLQQALVYVHR